MNEIGLRMALGASHGDVLGLVMKQALMLAGAGVALGLAGAIAATRLLTSFLFAVNAGDPLDLPGGSGSSGDRRDGRELSAGQEGDQSGSSGGAATGVDT